MVLMLIVVHNDPYFPRRIRRPSPLTLAAMKVRGGIRIGGAVGKLATGFDFWPYVESIPIEDYRGYDCSGNRVHRTPETPRKK